MNERPTSPILHKTVAASGKNGSKGSVISLKPAVFGQVSLTCILKLNLDSVVFQLQSKTVACEWCQSMPSVGAQLTCGILCICGRDHSIFRRTG